MTAITYFLIKLYSFAHDRFYSYDTTYHLEKKDLTCIFQQ
jgi:hypothetical protein